MLFPILYGIRAGGGLCILLAIAVSALIVYKFFGNLLKALRGDDMKVREYIQDHLLAKDGVTKDQ